MKTALGPGCSSFLHPIIKVSLSYRTVECFSYWENTSFPTTNNQIKPYNEVFTEYHSDTHACGQTIRCDKFSFSGVTKGCSGVGSDKNTTQSSRIEPVSTSLQPKQDPTTSPLRYIDMPGTELEDIIIDILCLMLQWKSNWNWKNSANRLTYYI